LKDHTGPGGTASSNRNELVRNLDVKGENKIILQLKNQRVGESQRKGITALKTASTSVVIPSCPEISGGG